MTGHDLYVQAADVSLDQVTANGTNSDLNVLTTSGGLSIIDGSAGGTITLTKQGETGILSADALSAGTGVTLRSDTDIEAGTVDTAAGDLDFAAARDVTVDSSLEAVDVAIDAGGTITTGDISARDDIALRGGGALDVGTLASGVTVGQQGPIDQAGSADALLDENSDGPRSLFRPGVGGEPRSGHCERHQQRLDRAGDQRRSERHQWIGRRHDHAHQGGHDGNPSRRDIARRNRRNA